MRALVIVILAAVAIPPVATGATSVSGFATGAFVQQEWDVYNLWVNTTRTISLVVTWSDPFGPADLRRAEDLSLSIYQPGVWDEKCRPERDPCAFVEPDDYYARSIGCPPFNNGMEGGFLPDVPAGRYHVVVEGNLGITVPYTLTTDYASLTYNITRAAGAVFVPPC
ncbi:MAG TPA: hypothetical protein VI997_01160 [Candidatus Thermoplasmatota archaeon]|nr:hypothetical protein [Candidatus Thermoplasmatota archaeon]